MGVKSAVFYLDPPLVTLVVKWSITKKRFNFTNHSLDLVLFSVLFCLAQFLGENIESLPTVISLLVDL